MKVLIAGATGQVGGALQRLAPAWAQVSAIASADCDLTDTAMLQALLKRESPELVINAAAYTAVDKAESEEALARAVNSGAVETLVQAMAPTGAKLVHISTDFVFDGSSARAYVPEDLRNPLSVYGRTKAEGEDHLRGEDLLVRTAWVYEAAGANFVRTMIRIMKERDNLGIVADQIGSPTWATGLARTIWKLIEREATGTFHHSDAGVASWYDFAVAIGEEAQALGLIARVPDIRPITTEEYPTPAQRPMFSLLDCRATRKLLDEQPVHWRTNLRSMLEKEAELG